MRATGFYPGTSGLSWQGRTTAGAPMARMKPTMIPSKVIITLEEEEMVNLVEAFEGAATKVVEEEATLEDEDVEDKEAILFNIDQLAAAKETRWQITDLIPADCLPDKTAPAKFPGKKRGSTGDRTPT
eukprot:GHVU01034199.1.p3 GENE.GHVU01034199.1~~GHVU01034199.1.p3  ORF type:complete len:128 (+),score=27.24 GHVU01034199.1:73-456(+)